MSMSPRALTGVSYTAARKAEGDQGGRFRPGGPDLMRRALAVAQDHDEGSSLRAGLDEQSGKRDCPISFIVRRHEAGCDSR